MTARFLAKCLLLLAAPVLGQSPNLVDPSAMPGPLKKVGFAQRIGDPLPLDAAFVDELGREVTLGDYFTGDRPAVLALVYYDCPMLCSLIMSGVAKTLSVLELQTGKDFDVIAISFAPGETPSMAREAKIDALDRYGKASAEGWHFLSSPDGGDEAIRRVTAAAGFDYTWVPGSAERSGEYAHAAGVLVVTPEGKLAKYFYGIEYPPRDLRLALVEASAGRLGTVVDQLLLYCFRYDPTLGKYTAAVTRILRLTGVAFCLALATFLWVSFRRDRPHRSQPDAGAAR
jgi:protein SCO1/2